MAGQGDEVVGVPPVVAVEQARAGCWPWQSQADLEGRLEEVLPCSEISRVFAQNLVFAEKSSFAQN